MNEEDVVALLARALDETPGSTLDPRPAHDRRFFFEQNRRRAVSGFERATSRAHPYHGGVTRGVVSQLRRARPFRIERFQMDGSDDAKLVLEVFKRRRGELPLFLFLWGKPAARLMLLRNVAGLSPTRCRHMHRRHRSWR